MWVRRRWPSNKERANGSKAGTVETYPRETSAFTRARVDAGRTTSLSEIRRSRPIIGIDQGGQATDLHEASPLRFICEPCDVLGARLERPS